jgi:hypothetical protein
MFAIRLMAVFRHSPRGPRRFAKVFSDWGR